MADVKISELPTADALQGDELVPVVQSSETRQTTAAAIAALASGARAIGQISQSGAITRGEGVDSVVWTNPGIYQVIFTPDLFSTAPIVTATPLTSEGVHIIQIDSVDASQVTFRVWTPAGDLDNDAFNFQAFEVSA